MTDKMLGRTPNGKVNVDVNGIDYSKCIVCGKELSYYKPEYCCSGWECGCMGAPINPPLCLSIKCHRKVFGYED